MALRDILVTVKSPQVILRYDGSTWVSGPAVPTGATDPQGIAVAPDGDVVLIDVTTLKIYRHNNTSWDDGLAIPTAATAPAGIAVAPNGDVLLVDVTTLKIYRHNGVSWDDGLAIRSNTSFPAGLAVNPQNSKLSYIDGGTRRIYTHSGTSWDGGLAIKSRSLVSTGLSIDINGDFLYVDPLSVQVFRYSGGSWDSDADALSIPTQGGSSLVTGLAIDYVIVPQRLAIAAESRMSSLVLGIHTILFPTQKLAISVGNSLSSTVVGLRRVALSSRELAIAVRNSTPSTLVVGVRHVRHVPHALAIGVVPSRPSTLAVGVTAVNLQNRKLTIRSQARASTLRVGVNTFFPPLDLALPSKLPQLQVVFDGGRYRWADAFDERAQATSADAFVERLFPQSRIFDKLPDPFRAILADRVATISCSNTRNANEAWRNKTTQQIEALHSSDVSFNEIVILNRLRQRRVSVTLRDHTNARDLMSVKGFMSRISRKANRGSFTITGIDRNKLKVKIPTVSIADIFPSAVEYNSAITNESVRVVFGQAVRMKLYRLSADHSTFGPIDLSAGGIGSLTLQSVYRDGMIVPTGQYRLTTLQDADANYYGVVQFLNETGTAESAATQQAASPSIQVDVLNVGYKQNHARAIRWAVQAAGFAIDAASFDAAETKFTALSYVVDGAITKRKVLEDVLRELLVRGAYLTQIETGTDSATVTRLGLVVDEASNHSQINDLDILWTDRAKTIEDVADFSEKEFADIPKTFKIEGYFDAGVGGDVNGWRMAAVKTNSAASEGRDIEVTNSFIYDPDTLRSECDYRAKRLFSDVAALKVAVIPKLSGSLKLARTINTELFPLGVYSSLWMITELEYNAGKYLAQLTPYDQAWYTYSSNNLAFISNVNFSSVSDFSHTRPSRPTGFELNGGMAALLVVGNPGTYSAIAPLRADAPAANPKNIDSLVFDAFRDGEAFPFLTKKIPVKPQQQNVSVVMVLQPNVTYDFACHAYKEGNFFDSRQDYRESFRATINNVTTPEPSVLATGFRWRGAWRARRLYLVGDVTTNDGIAWVTVVRHTSTDLAPTEANGGGLNWELFTNKGPRGRGIVSTIRRDNFIIVTYSDGTTDSIPIRDGKPGLPGPSASFRWNNRIENTSGGSRPTNALITQVSGGWALSGTSGSSLPASFVYTWTFLISGRDKVIWFNGIPSVPNVEHAEYFNQTVADPGGSAGIGDILTIQNAANPQGQWADFEVKGIVAYGLGTSKWWGLQVAFYGDSVEPTSPPDPTEIIIRFSRVLQPPEGDDLIGRPGDDNTSAEGIHTIDVLPSRVGITTAWKTLLTRTITLTSEGEISVRGEFVARIFGQGSVRVEGRVQLIQGAATNTGTAQSVTQNISQTLLQTSRGFVLRAIPSLTRDLGASAFTARLQVRYVVVSGAVLHSDVTGGVWSPRVSSANMIVTSGAPAIIPEDEITTTMFVGYQLGTRSPSVPSSFDETPPQAWQTSRPNATTTQGVYELVGIRTFRNGVFESTVWTVSRVEAPTGSTDPVGVVSTTSVTRYRRATSRPSRPSSSTEDVPDGWDRTEPTATSTQGVYRLVGTRTYIDGVFQSTSWSITLRQSPGGTITRTTTVGYRLDTSTPSKPSSSTEDYPTGDDGWSNSRPDATSTQGVYRLTGVRSYRSGVFQSTTWTIIRTSSPETVTTRTYTGYRRARSLPSVPNASTEDPPDAWSTTKPTATRTQGVYKITGIRTYHAGVFHSASWSVSRVTAPISGVTVPTWTQSSIPNLGASSRVTVGGDRWTALDYASRLRNTTSIRATYVGTRLPLLSGIFTTGRATLSTSGTILTLDYTREGGIRVTITPYNGSTKGATRSLDIYIGREVT